VTVRRPAEPLAPPRRTVGALEHLAAKIEAIEAAEEAEPG
jgi:hypothetical protein